MARVPYLDRAEASAELQPLYDKIEKLPEALQVSCKVLAHSPKAPGVILAIGDVWGNMKLNPRLRELAFLKASLLNGAAL